MEEIWKDIEGCDGRYKVSNLGRVKSIRKIKYRNCYKETILKPVIQKSNGYCYVSLRNENGIFKNHRIHRLVAKAFIPNPNNYSQVNHIDMNKQNNCVENLEWCDQFENMRKCFELKPEIAMYPRTEKQIIAAKETIKYARTFIKRSKVLS